MFLIEIQLQTGNSDIVTASLPPRAGSSGSLPPVIKVRTPTVRSSPAKQRRTTEPALTKTKLNRSSENLLNDGPLGAPARPSSRNRKVSDSVSNRPVTPTRHLNSGRKSPVRTRDESPVRNKGGSMSRKFAQLTADSLKQFVSLIQILLLESCH